MNKIKTAFVFCGLVLSYGLFAYSDSGTTSTHNANTEGTSTYGSGNTSGSDSTPILRDANGVRSKTTTEDSTPNKAINPPQPQGTPTHHDQ